MEFEFDLQTATQAALLVLQKILLEDKEFIKQMVLIMAAIAKEEEEKNLQLHLN